MSEWLDLLQTYQAEIAGKGAPPLRKAIAIAATPSDELFVLYNTGEVWRYYYTPGSVNEQGLWVSERKWEKLDLPDA